MLHLITCRLTRPYWHAVRAFCETVLGVPHQQFLERLIIFNTVRPQEMASVEACAFIRHAVNCFYRDFAMVDTHDRAFMWERTFANTMHNFRSAVLAWAQSIRVFTTLRQHTNRKKRVAEDTLKKFTTLVTFSDEGYTFALTPAFKQAIARAEAAVKARG